MKRLAPSPTIQAILFSALRGTGSEEALELLREWLQLESPGAEQS